MEVCAVLTPSCAVSCVEPHFEHGIHCKTADKYHLDEKQKVVALVSGGCGTEMGKERNWFSNPDIFYHTEFSINETEIFRGGFIGVDIFFVI